MCLGISSARIVTPLEKILKSFKYDREKISEAMQLIFRTYTVLKADDVLRDERSRIKRAFAKVVRKFHGLRLPHELNYILARALLASFEISTVFELYGKYILKDLLLIFFYEHNTQWHF